MDEFMTEYEEQYEHNFTIQNKDIKTSTIYLNESKNLSYNKYKAAFMYNNTTLIEYLESLNVENIPYLNFTYNYYNYVISYNFAYKVIVVYMGKNYNDKDLNWAISKTPIIGNFKLIHNEQQSAFRIYDNKFEPIIVDNVIKFISNYPMEFKQFISKYISKSYNYGPRLKMYNKLAELHKNLNILEMSSKYMRSFDNKYMVVMKYLSPSPGLVVNIGIDPILVNIYDRKNTLIRVLELPPFDLIQLSELTIYILEDDYEINFDESYYLILNILTVSFFQRQPSNNNSPSSE